MICIYDEYFKGKTQQCIKDMDCKSCPIHDLINLAQEASKQDVEADTQGPCSSVETCEIHYDSGDSACVDCPQRTS